jgi:hypothetical protein
MVGLIGAPLTTQARTVWYPAELDLRADLLPPSLHGSLDMTCTGP